MTWDNVISPYTFPSILILLFLLIISGYSWRHRGVPGALQLSIGCLFSAMWLFGILMEYVEAEPSARIFWVKFQAMCQLPAVTANTCFLLEYTWPGRWLNRRNVALLSIAPLFFAALALTNDLHHLVWLSFVTDGTVIHRIGTSILWVFLIYGYALGLLQVIIYIWLLRHTAHNRWPIAFMLFGHLVARVVYLLDQAEVLRTNLHIETIIIGYLFSMFAIALFYFRIFDPIAQARQTVIAQMHDGMVVLNSQSQVASMNPVAEVVLNVKAKYARRRPIQQFLPAGVRLPDGDEQVEIYLKKGSSDCACLLTVSRLKDWRGLAIGSLLLLRDVTEQKRAQALIIEQQRALAMLQEREQLARELHDSTAQVLGFAGLKIGAARKLIADGKLPGADDQLARLESVVAEAHADVREYILHLRAAPIGDKPFFAALQQYIDGYRQNYAIQVQLAVGEGMHDAIFAPEAQMQVFRIIQEAMSNARKHSGADCIQLSFENDGGMVRVRIVDNGGVFDSRLASGATGHYGLRFMLERAGQLGGELHIQSAPGAGTCVVLDAPCAGDEKAAIYE